MYNKNKKNRSKKRYRSSRKNTPNKSSKNEPSIDNNGKRRSTSKHSIENNIKIKEQKFKEKLESENDRIQKDLNKLDQDFKNEIEKIKNHKVDCSICKKTIEDMLSAIGSKKNNDTRHFKCAQKEILKNEKLLQNEKLTYIGGGDFVIIQNQIKKGKKSILLRKRINYKDPTSAQISADG